MNGQKHYHTKATDNAAKTVEAHSSPSRFQLYGSCFCPFVQKVWISLEQKELPYQYIEIDPYKKPKELMEINPRGLVPALRDSVRGWGCYESTVLMEFLEDFGETEDVPPKRLLPGSAWLRAEARLWTDHITRHVTPAFYRFLQAQEEAKRQEAKKEFEEELDQFVEALVLSKRDEHGPFFFGSTELGFVDIQLAPWAVRIPRVLKPYRQYTYTPFSGHKPTTNISQEKAREAWQAWLDAVENTASVKKTISDDELYLDSYERYAQNRPNTSKVADAINAGRGLP
ncbi:hypothetical protein BZG36_00349 [Bifiguratus adelaidae]|uniref:GST N-terminal domain-containing protein n=1 Tax=Bifiguratus adelaidae TaxID=1938954 RepID=A0A261Y7Y3_9FUNG|nr:hypothetical protein BZG36_00349 [Bifiguratus adelaidae]